MDYSARVTRTCGCVAQLVEQLTLNQWVWGSNPHAPTNKEAGFYAGFFLWLEA